MITTVQIAVSSLILLGAHCIAWPRRENLLAYVSLATWSTTVALPLFAAGVTDRFDPSLVERLADLLALGAAGYAVGVVVGTALGRGCKVSIPFTFGRRAREQALTVVHARARRLGAAGLAALLGAFGVMGYAPLLAQQRTAAKYGVGIYQVGFDRAAPLYLFGLALCGVMVPVLVSAWMSRRRPFDLLLAAAITLALLLSLSRTLAVSGLVLVAAGVLVARGVRVRTVVTAVIGAYLAGAALNPLVLEPAAVPTPIIEQMADSAPDVRDALLFLDGFEASGSEHVGARTFIAGLGVGSSGFDPGTYSLRILTGAEDVSGLASGGLRLPAPVWGHVAAGAPGVLVVSFLSGVFAAWGMALLARLVADGAVLHHQILAATFYLGTFGVLAASYAPSTSGLVLLAVSVATGVDLRRANGVGASVPAPELVHR